MKKEILVLFLLIILIIGLSGCDRLKTNDNGISTKRYVGGDKGLEIEFEKNAPPERVGDDNSDEFDISLILKNKGEYNINKGEIIVTLQGLEKDAFSLGSLSKKSDFSLDGAEKFRDRTNEGEENTLEFRKLKYKHDLDADFPINIRADVCYEYETRATANLCLKKEANKRRGIRDQCDINEEKVEIENSGGPVKIENVEQRASGSDEIKFTFDVVAEVDDKHQIYEPGTFNSECGIDLDKEDRVEVELSTAGDVNIKCGKLDDRDRGEVDLIEGSRTITCGIKTSSLQEYAFEKQLKINVRYMYKDSSAEVDLTVEDSAR